jgi:hypothetical protein
MSVKNLNYFSSISIILILLLCVVLPVGAQTKAKETISPDTQLLNAMHSISSHEIFHYVQELCKDEFGGRLTGTDSYNKSAQWLADYLEQWGVQPASDNGTFFQDFPHPYTLVKESGSLTLHIPQKKKSVIDKHYLYETDYMPGSTSASGKLSAEVIYVGYGISAPELGYDEYKGLDVKGKIVLMEREIPINPVKEPE